MMHLKNPTNNFEFRDERK